MDPVSVIGLAANVTAILQLTSVCLKLIKRRVGPSKHSPEKLQIISASLYAFNGAISNFKVHLEICEEDEARLQALSYLQKPLDDSKTALRILQDRIQNATFWAQFFLGVRFDAKLKKCLNSLDYGRALFDEALQADQCTLLSAVEKYVRNVAEDVQLMRGDLSDTTQHLVNIRERNGQNDQELKRLHLDLGDRIDKIIQSERHILGHVEASKTETKLKFQKDKNRTMVDWLSTRNFWKSHNDIISRRHQKTGSWFLETPQFREWMEGSASTLWCVGIPGAGKSILASIAVDYLLQNLDRRDATVVCVYFKYKEERSQSALDIVTSILQQLITANSTVPDALETLYDSHINRKTRPSMDEIWTLLLPALHGERAKKAFIIIDALDECAENDFRRAKVLREIQRMRPYVHLLVTSRYQNGIADLFNDAIYLEISADDRDIRQYCESRIQTDRRLMLHTTKDEVLQEEICETIIQNSRGMFLLAELHLDFIASRYDKRGVRSALLCLPKELDQTYDDAMQRIRQQDEAAVELAERALSWLCFAYAPLSVKELQHALAVRPEDTSFDDEAIVDANLIVSVCAGMVTIDLKSEIIRLVHHTTQAYFERRRYDYFPSAHMYITNICLNYISFIPLEDPFKRVIDKTDGKIRVAKYGLLKVYQTFPLFSYAAQYLGYHAQGEPEKQFQHLFLELFTNPLKVERLFQDPRRPCQRISDLSVAAFYGLERIVKLFLERGADVSAKDNLGYTALHHAVAQGHESVVHILLEYGSDVHARAVLDMACENDDEVLVGLVLQKGLDMAKYWLGGGNVLIQATSGSCEAMARLFLDWGAEPDIGSKVVGPALITSLTRHADMLMSLLEEGIITGDQALRDAASGSRTDVVRLLLNWGDSSMIVFDIVTALVTAMRPGSCKKFQLHSTLYSANVPIENLRSRW